MTILDQDIVSQLREDMAPEDLARLLGLFRSDVAGALAAIEAAVAGGDETALKRAAHRLAGCAGSVGASALDTAARRMMAEGLAASGPLVPVVKAAAAAASDALEEAFS